MSTMPVEAASGRVSPPSRESSALPLDVVFVCTGNRARSPLAELLFRRYAGGAAVRVRSVGTLGLEGLPALEVAVQAARELDLDLREHRSTGLRGLDLSAADLVIGFEPVHLAVAIEEAGARPERTFLLGELVALLGPAAAGARDADAADRARALTTDASERRGRRTWAPGGVIEDPVGKPLEVMRSTAAQIDRLVETVVERLLGARVD